jgi:rifampicin phosphotransferase
MTDLVPFEQIGPGDADAVGGKGLSLGLLASAGLPVPPGFCVTAAAFRRARGKPLAEQPDLSEPLAAAYRALGGGPVAVRSSATAEDGAVTSFAGQQETILGVVGENAVRDAVARCWASLDTERAVAYRRKQGVGDEGLAMAVVVQRLVPAEVAGVLFTRDPLDPSGRRMLVEASWGLGEAVVSGRVTPDRFALDRASGAVVERQVHDKAVEVTADGPRDVPPERRTQPCLDDARLKELAELGRRVEDFYGAPRDVEWAYAGGRFWLLQARPITVADAGERERVRQEEIAALRAKGEPTGTVWSRFNLSESLPEPTPMTWAITRRFMSGRGGFGLMYRDLGFDPDPALDDEGVFDLVCGRPYCNLSREARLHYRLLPFEHPFGALKADPQKALYPQPGLNPARAGWKFWLGLPVLLPWMIVKMTRAALRQQQLMQTFPAQFRTEILPPFVREADAALAEDLSALDGAALAAKLEHWIRRGLYDFAREGLKATALAGLVMAGIENKLAPALGPDRARAAVRDLIMSVRFDPDSDLGSALRDLDAGRLTKEEFLKRFGHRGSQEMELSHPRWSEDHAALDRQTAAHRAAGPRTEGEGREAALTRVAAAANLSEPKQAALRTEAETLHTLLALRETAKHYLMKGHAVLRRVLLELDRRYRLQGGVFFLLPEELPRLTAGEDLSGLIAERRKRRAAALRLEVPPVLFSDDLEAIGRPPAPPDGAAELKGVPLSAGVAEAPALVLESPEGVAAPPEPYILVCPSTDPAWVPLFVGAKGLVMETGGVLSHGAIVAREFGLPAVAGLAGVTRRLRTGQRLRVDGGGGSVIVLSDGPPPT